MTNERTSYLLKQYIHGSINAIELHELMELLLHKGGSGSLKDALEGIIDQSPALSGYQEAEWEPLYRSIILEKGRRTDDIPARGAVIRFHSRTSWYAAAAILFFFTGTAWLMFFKNGRQKAATIAATLPQKPKDDIGPGGNKAILTLADGSTIDMDEAKNGLMGQQGSSKLVKLNDNQLAYRHETGKHPMEIQYNLLTTPRGGQYQLILPDGSKVWLNAASSIRYPTAFIGKVRNVELTGEAYFEVAQNASMPFRVHIAPTPGRTEGMNVEVLGTHFNVMAYADEQNISTTLLEGSVRLSLNSRGSVMLRPGEQAKLNDAGVFNVAPADVEEAVAWKNGLFRFNEATIEEVMRQLSRWYDVEVVYVNEAPKDPFRGEIYRNVNVSKVLKVLEASGVHFTVEGKKILVQP
jgi:transmembrane sensor